MGILAHKYHKNTGGGIRFCTTSALNLEEASCVPHATLCFGDIVTVPLL